MFWICRQNGSQIRKNLGYRKVTVVLISHFRGMIDVTDAYCHLHENILQ